jgi:hypothetical protein
MTCPQSFPFIPQARPMAINDRELATLTQLALDSRMGNITSAEAEWVLTAAGPLMQELQARRAAMASLQIGLDTANVIQIGGR